MSTRDIRDLASITAEIIRRTRAAYASPDDWRRDLKAALAAEKSKILEEKRNA